MDTDGARDGHSSDTSEEQDNQALMQASAHLLNVRLRVLSVPTPAVAALTSVRPRAGIRV